MRNASAMRDTLVGLALVGLSGAGLYAMVKEPFVSEECLRGAARMATLDTHIYRVTSLRTSLKEYITDTAKNGQREYGLSEVIQKTEDMLKYGQLANAVDVLGRWLMVLQTERTSPEYAVVEPQVRRRDRLFLGAAGMFFFGAAGLGAHVIRVFSRSQKKGDTNS